ncbi:hypothetical protein [uncultured Paracoccus sp.]|uniref:HNH endonuclease n=1 Tax=uncultured Paracoccus sp. TaxID=189685 RepID=UPI00260DECF5|nr:hypothetical protein [uncultured Paracoccus sp.]
MAEKMVLPDPYQPSLDTCVFTDDEEAAIANALATEKPWDWRPGGAEEESLRSAKAKIRDCHLARHGDRCCYCRFPLHGGGHFIVDPEHVLPKSNNTYRPLAYAVWNLGISCKRCNMQYKGAKIDFVVDAVNDAAFQDSANYRLIHPNFDSYKDHISISMAMNDDTTLIKYTTHQGSEKGSYTYDYFNLREREVGTFDAAQGRDVPDELGNGAREARELAREYGQ